MFATDSSLYFTTGEFRNRPLAQKVDNDYGKILNIEFKIKFVSSMIFL